MGRRMGWARTVPTEPGACAEGHVRFNVSLSLPLFPSMSQALGSSPVLSPMHVRPSSRAPRQRRLTGWGVSPTVCVAGRAGAPRRTIVTTAAAFAPAIFGGGRPPPSAGALPSGSSLLPAGVLAAARCAPNPWTLPFLRHWGEGPPPSSPAAPRAASVSGCLP